MEEDKMENLFTTTRCFDTFKIKEGMAIEFRKHEFGEHIFGIITKVNKNCIHVAVYDKTRSPDCCNVTPIWADHLKDDWIKIIGKN